MKKTLFIAIAIAGCSQISFAQESAKMTAGPTKAQSERATQEKKQAKAEAKAAPATARSTKMDFSDPNKEAYIKAGATDRQVAEMEEPIKALDRKKFKIENDTQMSAADKAQAIAAIEAEKNTIRRRAMGEETYKKFTLEQSPKQQAKGKN